MGSITNTFPEVLYAGPPSNYPAAAAASTAAQSLIAGASGDFSQPRVPGGYIQDGRINTLFEGSLSGILTGQASATTAIITIGLNNSANTIGGTTLLATPAITVTSLAGVGWDMTFRMVVRTVGYGTTTISSTFLSSGLFVVGSTNLVVACVPNSVTTIDASITNWLYVTVTFSTSSATNSCTLQQIILKGMN